MSVAQCAAQGGIYQGDCTDCLSQPCPTAGACCVTTTCTVEADQAACLAIGGTWLGIDTDCTGDPCAVPPTIGACCFDDGVCTDVIETACSGTWFDSIPCADNPCPPIPGACCDPFSGNC